MEQVHIDFWRTTGNEMIARWPRAIIVDFMPGHGGHFLAHAINLCLFDLQPDKDTFTSYGTINPWTGGRQYIDQMQCFAVHWSDHDIDIDPYKDNWVVRLKCDSHVNQFISTVNQTLRAGDRHYQGLPLETHLGKRVQARRFWHHFINSVQCKWKQHTGSVTDISISILWHPTYLRRWLTDFANRYSGKTAMPLADRLEHDHNRWLVNNHGWQIWKESGQLWRDHLDDDTMHACPTVWHDCAVLLRLVSILQCQLDPDSIDTLVMTYFENDLDFQILRQQYKNHVL